MMYNPIKFGCKKISRSVNVLETVIFDYMSPHCDPELEDRGYKSTLAQDDASPYQVWLQKIQQLRRYCSNEHSPEFSNVPVTLTLTITEQSNLFTRQSSL